MRAVRVMGIMICLMLLCVFGAAAAGELPFENARSARLDIGGADGYVQTFSARASLSSQTAARLLGDALMQSEPISDPEAYDREVNPDGNAMTPFVKRERPERKANTITLSAGGSSRTLYVIRCGDAHGVFVYRDKYYALTPAAMEIIYMLREAPSPLPSASSDAAIKLLRDKGLNPAFAVRKRTYSLPKRLDKLSSEDGADKVMFIMAAQLSKAVGLDMEKAAGRQVTAEVYPLLRGQRDPYDMEPFPYAVVYRLNNEVVGAHLGLPYILRDTGLAQAQALDGRTLSEISGVEDANYIASVIDMEDAKEQEAKERKPVAAVRAYIQAVRGGNRAAAARLCSRQMMSDGLFTWEKYAPAFALPEVSALRAGSPYSSARLYRVASSQPESGEQDEAIVLLDATMGLRESARGLLNDGEIMRVMLVREYEGGPWRVDWVE